MQPGCDGQTLKGNTGTGAGQSGDDEAAVITYLMGKVRPGSVNRVKSDPKQ